MDVRWDADANEGTRYCVEELVEEGDKDGRRRHVGQWVEVGRKVKPFV